MTQIERIAHMETLMNQTEDAVRDLSRAVERFRAAQDDIRELKAYYTGGQWLRDYDDDCEGRLPADLRRGVLSQDALHNLLQEAERLNACIPDRDP